MSWIYLILAGLCEMFGVAMMSELSKRRTWKTVVLLIAGFGLSFVFLSLAMLQLPMSTAYAVWTGIGASGGALVGMLFYGESKDVRRVLCIMLIIASVIGLKIIG